MLPIELAARPVVRACHVADDDLPSLRDRFLDRLRRVVPIDAAFFAAADPDTLLFTFASADEPLVRAGSSFLEHELADTEDVNRFAALARARRPVATLDRATMGRRAASARFREVIAPLGLGDELRVALRTRTTTWGFLCLHREGSFDDRDVAVLQHVAAHAAEAIRRIVAASLTSATDGQAGVILVAEERVIAITDASTIWLGADVKAGDPLPLSLRPVLRRLDAIENGTSSDLPAIRLVSSAGKLLEANAARLRGDGRTVAITVGPATARARSDVRLAAHDLTPAQRRVTSLVIQGRSTKQIVAELQIGEHTVQDHLKAVFDKLGVASRRELVASLLR